LPKQPARQPVPPARDASVSNSRDPPDQSDFPAFFEPTIEDILDPGPDFLRQQQEILMELSRQRFTNSTLTVSEMKARDKQKLISLRLELQRQAAAVKLHEQLMNETYSADDSEVSDEDSYVEVRYSAPPLETPQENTIPSPPHIPAKTVDRATEDVVIPMLPSFSFPQSHATSLPSYRDDAKNFISDLDFMFRATVTESIFSIVYTYYTYNRKYKGNMKMNRNRIIILHHTFQESKQ
jgi:hypothetical protein